MELITDPEERERQRVMLEGEGERSDLSDKFWSCGLGSVLGTE